MKKINKQISSELKKLGVDFIHFVDISQFSFEQNRGYSSAILFGIPLTPYYIHEVIHTPDYVRNRVNNNYDFDDDELFLKEIETDRISDRMADYLINKGFNAYSQSDANQIKTTDFDGICGKTLLPHKTIASLAGLGWIGKNNLLVTPQYGSAQCLGSILTDAPLITTSTSPIDPSCGNCRICKDVCKDNALKGNTWNRQTEREEMINVYQCTTCMKCLIFCPWTQKYMKEMIDK